MTSPAVRLVGATKTFGAHTAVSGFDLEIPQGSIYGLLGPNGSGKTTTIRMIMGILLPDEGLRRALRRRPRLRPPKPGGLPPGGARRLREDEGGGPAGLPGRDQGHGAADGPQAGDGVAGTAGAGRLGAQEGARPVEGDAAEGPVHRHGPPRAGTADPGRAVQRPGPDQSGRAGVDRAGAAGQGDDDPLLDPPDGASGALSANGCV